jgi:hypothetical protein
MNVFIMIRPDGSRVKGYLQWSEEDHCKRSVIFVPINPSPKKKGK